MYAIRVNTDIKANRVSSRIQPIRSDSNSVGFFIGVNEMKTLDIMAIPISQGLFALVDGKNYERLICYKWYALKSRNTY